MFRSEGGLGSKEFELYLNQEEKDIKESLLCMGKQQEYLNSYIENIKKIPTIMNSYVNKFIKVYGETDPTYPYLNQILDLSEDFEKNIGELVKKIEKNLHHIQDISFNSELTIEMICKEKGGNKRASFLTSGTREDQIRKKIDKYYKDKQESYSTTIVSVIEESKKIIDIFNNNVCKNLVKIINNFKKKKVREKREISPIISILDDTLEISKIIPQKIYLGNCYGAYEPYILSDNDIDVIVNCAVEIPNYYSKHIKYYNFKIKDEKSVDVFSLFERFYSIMEKHENEIIFVHCIAGISRSSTLLISYFMKKNKWSFKKAFTFIRKRRRIIYPNEGFITQLRDYEKQLFGNIESPDFILPLPEDMEILMTDAEMNKSEEVKKKKKESLGKRMTKAFQDGFKSKNTLFQSQQKLLGIKSVFDQHQFKSENKNLKKIIVHKMGNVQKKIGGDRTSNTSNASELSDSSKYPYGNAAENNSDDEYESEEENEEKEEVNEIKKNNNNNNDDDDDSSSSDDEDVNVNDFLMKFKLEQKRKKENCITYNPKKKNSSAVERPISPVLKTKKKERKPSLIFEDECKPNYGLKYSKLTPPHPKSKEKHHSIIKKRSEETEEFGDDSLKSMIGGLIDNEEKQNELLNQNLILPGPKTIHKKKKKNFEESYDERNIKKNKHQEEYEKMYKNNIYKNQHDDEEEEKELNSLYHERKKYGLRITQYKKSKKPPNPKIDNRNNNNNNDKQSIKRVKFSSYMRYRAEVASKKLSQSVKKKLIKSNEQVDNFSSKSRGSAVPPIPKNVQRPDFGNEHIRKKRPPKPLRRPPQIPGKNQRKVSSNKFKSFEKKPEIKLSKDENKPSPSKMNIKKKRPVSPSLLKRWPPIKNNEKKVVPPPPKNLKKERRRSSQKKIKRPSSLTDDKYNEIIDSDWSYELNDSLMGPFDFNEFKLLFRKGKINFNSRVLGGQMNDFQRLNTLPNLYFLLKNNI